MIKLSKRQVLMLHAQLIKETGGAEGLRDENLLESATEEPYQSFNGEELYSSIQAKAARLCYGYTHTDDVKNPPFWGFSRNPRGSNP